MASDARKKERQRRKRQQKQRDLRRAQTGSPYRRIGEAGKAEACYINRDWREDGKAAIYCLRAVPGGGHALAAFLVDLWCIGLKDAWGRLDITADEFKHQVSRMRENMEIIRIEPELAKRIVAGGVRFAKENGFRLPRRYERWVALLGGVGAVNSADLTDFGKDGKLFYVGTTEDLSQRLIQGSVDQFLAREDVHFIVEAHGFESAGLLDEDDEEIGEVFDSMKEKGLDAVRQWCFANGNEAHPRLPEAWDVTLEAICQVESFDDDDEPSDQGCSDAGDNIERLMGFESPQAQYELKEALHQLHGFTNQFDSPEAMLESLGLNTSTDLDLD
ncbi:MAG: hypothetical protein V3W34_06015 [Phycisphaerae bacterium]